MEGNGGSSSTMVEPTGVKPVIVRVKRKIAHSCLDAFWLEINERPSKRALIDLAKLSLSDSAGKEELKSKKVFVQHVKTVTNSEASIEIAFPYTADKIGSKTRVQERRDAFKKDNRQDRLSKSRQKQEESAKIARFQQVWRSRKGRKDCVDDAYHFYDVVRVDVARNNVQIQDTMSLEDRKLLSSYLPLLEEYIPGAAEEIENDLQSYISAKDEFVYDYYMVKDNTYMDEDDSVSPFPLVQVDDEDFYDVPSESEYDSEDSNAENNPLNDYPEEESDDDDDDDEEDEDDDDDEEESEVSDESEDEIEKSLEDDRFRNIRSMEDRPPVIYEPEDSYGDDYWDSDYCGDDNEPGYDNGDDGEW